MYKPLNYTAKEEETRDTLMTKVSHLTQLHLDRSFGRLVVQQVCTTHHLAIYIYIYDAKQYATWMVMAIRENKCFRIIHSIFLCHTPFWLMGYQKARLSHLKGWHRVTVSLHICFYHLQKDSRPCRRSEQERKNTSLSICRGAPPISHMLFCTWMTTFYSTGL